MAIGDDALADGMALVPGTAQANTIDTEINRTRDYIVQRIVAKLAALWPLSIARGGTGQTTAAAGLAALGGWVNTGAVSPGMSPRLGWNGARLQYEIPGYVGAVNLANLSDVGGFSGGVVPNDILLPNSSAATSSYTVAYINGDGRISRGASSERYKKYISSIDPASLGDVWPDLVRYQMRSGDGSWKYGYIAETLAESDDLRPFVVYADHDGTLVPESIDFIALLMVQNAQLHQAFDLLAQRIDALEVTP